MRAEDMTVGESYALKGPRRVKVTYLQTPPQIRAQRRVTVRFETGVPAGRVVNIPTVRIEGPWDRQATPVTKPAARRARGPLTVERPVRMGDTVVLAETGELAWTVAAVDEPTGNATVETEIFSQPRSQTVPVDSLQVLAPEPPPRRDLSEPRQEPRKATGAVADNGEDAVALLQPVTPRRELDELMDDILFTPACLDQYTRRLGSCKPRVANDRLRAEVRQAGFILRDGLAAGEFARIRVRGRFDIVLPHRPSPDALVYVDRLRLAAPKGRRGKDGQLSRQRRAT
jgi:hypothetical protein